jgi:acyl carrier protein
MNLDIVLRNIFREVFDDDELVISDSTSKDNVMEWDSVAHVKLVLAVEDFLNIRFSLDEVTFISSVGDFKESINKYI